MKWLTKIEHVRKMNKEREVLRLSRERICIQGRKRKNMLFSELSLMWFNQSVTSVTSKKKSD